MTNSRSLSIVAFAIFASVLTVLAAPAAVGAVNEELEALGTHTDFGTGDEAAPAELTHASVSGSGDSASVIGPVGGDVKADTTGGDGTTFSWSESSPSTERTLNLTGVVNTEWDNVSASNVSDGETVALNIGGNSDPSGPSSADEPVVSITGKALTESVLARESGKTDITAFRSPNDKSAFEGGKQPVSTGDFDGDGADEIVLSNATIYDPGDGSMTDLGVSNYGVGGVADIDADGVLEIMVHSDPDQELVAVEPDGTTTTIVTDITSIGGVGDIDGDAVLEVMAEKNSELVAVEPDGTTTTISTSNPYAIGGVGDWDGDGKAEIMMRASDTVMVDADGTTTVLNTYRPGPVTDFDGDGVVEAVGVNSDSYLTGSESGGSTTNYSVAVEYEKPAIETGHVGGPSENVGLDVDGDGTDEVSVSSVGFEDTVTREVAELTVSNDDVAVTTSGAVDLKVDLKERTQTTDTGVVLNGQSYNVSGTLADGETRLLTVSESDLVDGTNNGEITLNESGLTSDAPPMTVRAKIVDSYDTAQYVSANYTGASDVSAIAVNWSGTATLDVALQGWDGSSWQSAGSGQLTTTGNQTVSVSGGDYSKTRVVIDVSDGSAEIHDESILFEPTGPSASNFEPPDGTGLSDPSVDFSIDVSDADFGTAQGDTVTAQLQLQEPGSSSWVDYGSNSTTTNATLTVTETLSMGGDWQYRWVLSDSYGETTTTTSRTISVPATLTVRNESDTSQLVTGSSLEVTFYGETTVYTRNDSDGDGQINLTGLPADEPLLAVVSAPDYQTRSVVIPSLYQQTNIFLIDQNTTTVEARFKLQDNTGVFGEDSRIVVEKEITLNGTTAYRVVASDEVGVAGFTTDLVEGDRYRIKVVNQEGTTRTLGPYTADVTEEVTLEIGEVSFSASSRGDEYLWEAEWSNETAPPTITFSYDDNGTETTRIDVQVYQQANASNVILDETFTGEIGTVVTSVNVNNASLYDSNWVVKFQADRAGKSISGSWVVGPNRGDIGLNVDGDWAAWAALGVLVVVGAMLGGITPELGGLGVSVAGGVFLFVGWLPSFIGGGVVILALLLTGLYAVRGGGF